LRRGFGIRQQSFECLDDDYYDFHEDDRPESCFLCHLGVDETYVVRHMKSLRLVHLCECCMIEKLPEYFLDNTRPWKGPGGA